MNIKFIDNNTVKITASLSFSGGRPKNKIKKNVSEFLGKFKKKHPSYEILSVTGPRNITNFHDEGMSKGEWILKVEKKSKNITQPRKKTTKTKAGA